MKNKTKGIEIFTGITEELRKQGFDCFEVHPCRVVGEDKSLPIAIQSIEQCEPNEAEFWSVYVHLIGGGLDCIADCETEKQANELVEFLKVLCNVHDPNPDYHM